MGSSQAVRQRTLTPSCEGSIPSSPASIRRTADCVPVAQLDRVLDYESRGREFESLRARHRSIAQLGSAPALGAGGRGFKSRCSDQSFTGHACRRSCIACNVASESCEIHGGIAQGESTCLASRGPSVQIRLPPPQSLASCSVVVEMAGCVGVIKNRPQLVHIQIRSSIAQR
jgi:hypothetical protein